MKRNWLVLAGLVVLCEAVGIAGSIFTAPAIPAWYATLVKPAFAPPNWLFGPVWTTLYLLMGVAAYLVWQRRGPLRAFWVQLALNALWSPIFFGLHSTGLGLVCIALMWFAIVWTIYEFYKVSRPAAALMLPYLAWVSFASVLNYFLWALN